MARILILHASFGSGHRHAAEALRAALEAHPDVEVVVEDTLAYLGPVLQHAAQELYRQISEHAPRLYQLFYEATDLHHLDAAMRANLRSGRAYRPFLGDLERLIGRLAPDLIVGVQQLPLMVLSALRDDGTLRQPINAVVTDFAAHSSWVHPYIDRYFLPSAITAQLLVRLGVPADILEVTGIPVRAEIAAPKAPAAMRARHGLPPNGPVISLFGAGIEPQRVRLMLEGLLGLGAPLTLVTVTGRSTELAQHLDGLVGHGQVRLVALGQIAYVDDLVAASDLVITKAGGLIVSEVLARHTPLMIIDPIPGQEEWNADMVAAAGAGTQLRLPEMVPIAVQALLAQPARLALMRQRAAAVGRPHAAAAIARRLLADLRA
ncbi:MAG: galactosyldiacylglycerol synthase [Chloroflexales bacterium]